MASEVLYTIWQGGQLTIPFRETLGKDNSGGQLHTVQTADLSIPSIRQISELHSWIENKFMLPVLLCILVLFLPPNFTLSFHYPSSEGASVRIRSEDIMEKFSQLLSRNETHTFNTIHTCWFIKPISKRNCEQISKCREYPQTWTHFLYISILLPFHCTKPACYLEGCI